MVDQEIIHNRCLSDDPEKRIHALEELKNFFSSMPDKQQAWNDLHRLTNDQDNYVRSIAVKALDSAFSCIPDKYKQQAWNDLHKLTNDEYSCVRSKAAETIGSAFSQVPDKQQAWNDLLRLTNDEYSSVKEKAAETIGSAVSQVPDKQQVWNDLLKLTNDEDSYVRNRAAEVLGSAFSAVPDKQQAWNDLLKLTNSGYGYVNYRAVVALVSAFSQVSDKQQAWNDLLRLTNDEDNSVKCWAAEVLGSLFSTFPDKQQAWNDLLRLTNDQDNLVRSRAIEALGSSFSQVSDRQQAWNDLLRLTNDEYSYVRYIAAQTLGLAFSYVPDKQQAWNDLHGLTNDRYSYVRYSATKVLGFLFSAVPDKQQAWNDLHRLTNDQDSEVREKAVETIGSAFSQVPDKQQAWNDLHKLTSDKDSEVRYSATKVLGFLFSAVPDKQQAWNDLHKLTNDQDRSVRERAAQELVSAFSVVPDQQQAYNDLLRLTKDEDTYVRTSSNHSLGRVSIFKASKANKEEDYEKELEKAIEFFEKAVQESFVIWNNPSKFCFYFYRSFHTIIFKKQEAKEEVNKYLKEAKAAIGGSESKKQLIEAVENLSEALIEIHNLGNLDLQGMKSELNFYRKYCDHAAELMRDTNKKTPFATEVVRKGLPILDRKIKKLIDEIQDKAKSVHKQTIGTLAESLGLETNKIAKELSEDFFVLETKSETKELSKVVTNPVAFFDHPKLLEYQLKLNEIIESFKKYDGYFISGKKTEFLKMIEDTKKMDVLKKLEGIKELNEYISKNALFPRCDNIHIADRMKDIVRIATVQLSFTLSSSFPPAILNKNEMFDKINRALDKAKENKVDIICFPELSFCQEWLHIIKEKYSDITVIAGSYYSETNNNVCQMLFNSYDYVPSQLKIKPSIFEHGEYIQKMIPGEIINIYISQYGKIAVLICRDFPVYAPYLRGKTDIIFVPSYNKDINRFYSAAHNHVENSPSYILISNCSQYGGTAIFGIIHSASFDELVAVGYKRKDDKTYNLCEINKGEEGLIFADFNIIHKTLQIPTDSDPEYEVKPVKKITRIPL